MKRTTISLPDEVALLAEREARRRGTSLSEVAREALVAHLGLARSSDASPRSVPFASLGRSGYRHTARDMEHILAQEWAGDVERDRQ